MSLGEETYRDIDRFLNGEMTDAEEVSFREQIETNPELKEAIELEQELDKAIIQDGRMELKRKLQEIDQDHQAIDSNPHPSSGKRGFPWKPLAASILLLLAPLTLFLLYNSGSNPDEIVQKAILSASPNIDRGEGLDSLLILADLAFSKEDYKESNRLLEEYESSTPSEKIQNDTWQFHGIVLLRLDRPQNAEPYLQKFAEKAVSDNTRYWLLGITLFLQDKKAECLKVLDLVIKLDSENAEQAQVLREAFSDED